MDCVLFGMLLLLVLARVQPEFACRRIWQGDCEETTRGMSMGALAESVMQNSVDILAETWGHDGFERSR